MIKGMELDRCIMQQMISSTESGITELSKEEVFTTSRMVMIMKDILNFVQG